MKVYKHPNYSYITIMRAEYSDIQKLDLSICTQPKETIPNFIKRQEIKPDVVMNAGFFGMSNGATCFNLVDDGVVYGQTEKYQWGFGIAREHKRFIYGSLAANKDLFVDFISGYPVLLDNGKSCAPWTFATEINYKAARSIAGFDDKSIYFITIDKPGMTFDSMVTMLIGLGLKYAINCDGGGSTRMHVNGEVVNTPTENRAVDSVLCLYLTDEAKKAFYGEKDYYIYTVVSGDSWWRIAANQLGNGFLWTKLKEYNEWGENRTLNVGDQVKIPNNKFQEDTTKKDDAKEDTTPSTQPEEPKQDDSSKTDDTPKTDPVIKEAINIGTTIYDPNDDYYYFVDTAGNKARLWKKS